MSSTSTSNFLGVQLSVLKYCNIFYQEGKKKRKRYDQIHLELRKKIDTLFYRRQTALELRKKLETFASVPKLQLFDYFSEPCNM